MKKTLFILASLIASYWAYSQDSIVPVHIYRPGQFSGSLTNFSIEVDGELVCKLSNNKRISITLEPGSHVIQAIESGALSGLKMTTIKIVAKEGEPIYIKGDVKSSFTRLRLEMTRVFEDQYQKDLNRKDIQLDNCQLEG